MYVVTVYDKESRDALYVLVISETSHTVHTPGDEPGPASRLYLRLVFLEYCKLFERFRNKKKLSALASGVGDLGRKSCLLSRTP